MPGQKCRGAFQTEGRKRCLQRCHPVYRRCKITFIYFIILFDAPCEIIYLDFLMHSQSWYELLLHHSHKLVSHWDHIQETFKNNLFLNTKCKKCIRITDWVFCFRDFKPSGAPQAWLLIWKNKLVIGSGLWKTVINLPGKRRLSLCLLPTSLSANKKTGLPVGMETVLREGCSVMESRTAMTVQMKMLAVSDAYVRVSIYIYCHKFINAWYYPSNSYIVK